MSRFWGRFTLLIGALLLVASCDSMDKIGSPNVTPQLQTAQFEPALVDGALSGTPVEVQGTIGPEGGWVVMQGEGVHQAPAAHMLWVPPGAVDRPTLFTIRSASSEHTIVDLTAMQEINGRMVNVGRNGFAKPVMLGLSYAGLKISDLENLTITYLPQTGAPETMRSSVSPRAQMITASLTHFSRYAICAD